MSMAPNVTSVDLSSMVTVSDYQMNVSDHTIIYTRRTDYVPIDAKAAGKSWGP